MKKIFGEYFDCGYAVTSDSQGVTLEGVAVDQFQKWIDVSVKYQVLGVYPQNIQDSNRYAGEEIQLDVKKVINASKDIYFGCVEFRMGWYLFYKFSDKDIVRIKTK